MLFSTMSTCAMSVLTFIVCCSHRKNVDKDLLDSKKDVMSATDIYQRYKNVAAAGDEDDQMISLEYDDEYDDTYDSLLVGSTEPDADDDQHRLCLHAVLFLPVPQTPNIIMSNTFRPFTTPRVLMAAAAKNRKEFQLTDEDEDEQPKRGGNLDFVENPEVVRQRAEQKWLSKQQNHGPGGGGSARRDVKGLYSSDMLLKCRSSQLMRL